MDVNLNGFKRNCADEQMGDFFIHRERRMTEYETRIAVNWGILHGIELMSQLPDNVLDEICDPKCDKYNRYDDTPEFFTLRTLRSFLEEIAHRNYIGMTVDELIEKIEEKL